jgi:hypothetical protein
MSAIKYWTMRLRGRSSLINSPTWRALGTNHSNAVEIQPLRLSSIHTDFESLEKIQQNFIAGSKGAQGPEKAPVLIKGALR